MLAVLVMPVLAKSPLRAWSLLGALTAALVTGLHLVGLPAAFLLGAMGAAMIVVGRGGELALPARVFALAQAVVGCLIARNFTAAVFHTVLSRLGIFVCAVLSVLVVATIVGLILARARVLPGSTALWGVFPGAATVMVLLSGSFGGDTRRVAVMQYLRVVVVAVAASIVTRVAGHGGGAAPAVPWWTPIPSPFSLGVLVALIVAAAFVMPRVKVPAGALLGPMVVATLLQSTGRVRIELPQLLLIASYVVVGWSIGLRFTRESFAGIVKSLPQVFVAIVALVLGCAGIGWALGRIAHIDPLTAYLATSPGGADSIAILAAGTPIDMPFVMAAQISRFLAVLLLGPALAKRLAQLVPATGETR